MKTENKKETAAAHCHAANINHALLSTNTIDTYDQHQKIKGKTDKKCRKPDKTIFCI